MIVNEFVSGIIVLLIGYLLGSIPSAYIFTRLATGKDIRQIGGGNVGGYNTYLEAGALPAIGATIVDLGKGAATVAIAHWALNLDKPYVLIAAIGAVIGHNWMVWLKFKGGRGMGATIGALAVIMPIYGYFLPEFVILLGIIVVLLAITRNVALSMGIGLLTLPFIAWLSMHSGLFVIWSVVLGIIIAAKFAPTAISVIAKSTGIKDFIRGH
jgi:glycerol-3-phosphate acyltransferase PlsY